MNEVAATGQVVQRARAFPASLSRKLVLFSALATLITVALAFVTLASVIRHHTRSHLAELLAQNQRTVRDLRERSQRELLWVSTMMTESPTLRAALDTYQSEASAGAEQRADLLATIRTEVGKIRVLLGKDLAIVTDETGRILAASPSRDPLFETGRSLSTLSMVRQALQPGPSGWRPSIGVLDHADEPFQAGCAPIVMQGFVIGTLSLGERMDAVWLGGLRESLHSDVVLLQGDRVLGSTLPGAAADGLPRLSGIRAGTGSEAPALIELGREEYVVASLALGTDEEGRSANLILLQSLTGSLRAINRSLLTATLSCSLLAVILAGLAAWRVSRSVLGPLEQFVNFIRSVAATRDASLRFEGAVDSAEIRTLDEAFNHLLGSLQEQERQVLLRAKEELDRVERLKESEKLAALGRMLSGAAHEINNPLTAVVGNLELLMRSDRVDEGVRRRLQTVHREAHRVVALVKNLLKVAHRDAGTRSLVDVNQIVRETVELRRHDFSAAGIGLHLRLGDEPARLQANELELEQVFLNIINNALDALWEVPGEPALTIRAAREGDHASVIFEDNGPGMKDPGKVFEHFYTTKEVGKGTGLGLSITYAIVHGHGGTIEAENRPEGGARFTIALPVLSAGAEERQDSAEERPGAPAVLKSLVATALVVEDEPNILELQIMILESLGAQSVGVPSGAEAIAWLKRRDFEVIITDLKMPGLVSGEDLFRWAETHRPEMAGRFVFVTGDTASEVTREFLMRTRRRCVMKPFEMDDYVAAVRETLEAIRAAA